MVKVLLQVLKSISILLRKKYMAQNCSFGVKKLGEHRIIILHYSYSLSMYCCVLNP